MKYQYLKQWTVTPHYPFVPFLGKSVETGQRLLGITNEMKIELPHSLYYYLEKNGYIPDPAVKMNSLYAEWVKDRWWLYETEFIPERNKKCDLVFECVDYECIVYLNNDEIGRHKGANTPFRFDLGGLLKYGEKNFLRVLVMPGKEEAGQIGYTYNIRGRRPRFDNKWDFCTRLINVGIYRPVYLEYYDSARIDSVSFKTTDYKNRKGAARVKIFSRVAKTETVRVYVHDEGKCLFSDSRTVNLANGTTAVDFDVTVPNGELWFTNGEGKAKTYTLEACIDGEGAISSKTAIIGFREISFEMNPGSPESAIPYTFKVNGKCIYAKGFNLTPLDYRLGDETNEKYDRLVRLAKEANTNIIRVWGGGIIESEYFYRLCSENGIMIWQDLLQSSSGLSNEPPVDSEYLSALREETRNLIDSRSSYPCLAVITAGNELFGGDAKPITEEHPNIKVIKKVLDEEECTVRFITSTSSGPVQEASLTVPELNHDIHGPWLYGPDAEYYRHYNDLKCLFAGEFGCNGISSLAQLKRILGENDLRVTSAAINEKWRFHGEWWDMNSVITELFGKITDLNEFVAIGRFLQYNGLFYAVSSHKRNAPYQSGCMVWQLNETYPNAACTSLVEYYGNVKPAYFAAKQAFEKVLFSFEYEKLSFETGEETEIKAYFTSEESCPDIKAEFKVEKDGKTIVSEEIRGGTDTAMQTVLLKKFRFTVTAGKLYKFTLGGTVAGRNYISRAVMLVRGENGLCDKNALLNYISEMNLQ